MENALVITCLVLAIVAAGGWWAFANQKKANAALALAAQTAGQVKGAATGVVDAARKI